MPPETNTSTPPKKPCHLSPPLQMRAPRAKTIPRPPSQGDRRKTLPLDDQGGIKGGLDRASHVETGNPLIRYAARPPFATQKGEVLEVLQTSLPKEKPMHPHAKTILLTPSQETFANYVIPAKTGRLRDGTSIQRGWANGDPTTNV